MKTNWECAIKNILLTLLAGGSYSRCLKPQMSIMAPASGRDCHMEDTWRGSLLVAELCGLDGAGGLVW